LAAADAIDTTLLFARIAAGDEAAFGALFTAYAPSLHDYLQGLTKSHASAQELVQNTFIRVWLSRDKLPEIEHPRAWIFTVAANEAYNFLKKQAREEKALEGLARLPALSAGDETLYRELKAAIGEAIGALPERRAEIYKLSREQGMPQQEIAERLGISLQTVKNTLGAALEDIRRHLKDKGLWMLAILFWSS
jgi:RNA polymerase sigma-70 factor (family 1)